MRNLIDGADYLTTEIGVVLHLCEHIDKREDSELSTALPILHAVMRERLDDLNKVINKMVVEVRELA